jgi:hypothetical protein
MVSERASPAVDLVDVHVHEELVRWLVQNGHLLGSEKAEQRAHGFSVDFLWLVVDQATIGW